MKKFLSTGAFASLSLYAAFADNVVNDLEKQLTDYGYKVSNVDQIDSGYYLLKSYKKGHERHMLVDPKTGKVIRDIAIGVDENKDGLYDETDIGYLSTALFGGSLEKFDNFEPDDKNDEKSDESDDIDQDSDEPDADSDDDKEN